MELSAIQTVVSSFMDVLNFDCLLWIALGTLIGIVFGAAPGLTATTAVALFTPITFYMPLNISLSFLMGMYCGGFYAGSIPAILINTPGAPGNAATVMDGYPMAKNGQAGRALSVSVTSSYIGGTLSAFALLIFAPIIAKIALKFGAPEYFAVAVLGLVCIAGVSGRSIVKGIAGATIGMFLSTIGMDPIDGLPRFTLDSVYLMGGIALIPALVGLFAITEVLSKVDKMDDENNKVITQISGIMPHFSEYWHNKWLILKSSIIGILVGAVPGTGPTIASWMAYNEAKRSAKDPEKYGTGIPEGVMATEASNNAVTGGALIPLLTLGVPGDTVTAVLLGALMIQGLTPGPMLLTEHYDLVAFLLWILIFANIVMLLMGLLSSKFAPYILKIPVKILMPIVCVLCITGGYAANNSFFDAAMVIVIGLGGYILMSFGFPVAPVVLGLILGPIIEPNMRMALIGSGLNPFVFISTPLSAGLLVLAFVLVWVMNRRGRGAA
ncbi:tripartite tricarboxylate transporter permease [uncultured Phascolarctobacterium sp.]|uniref:tripartite tricarboxylate transporter permease n=1 Tax=uncultured Phascolarctobacterium sp. TaxID=512296 RepID=UPI0025FF0500|nr:tripartite tricarboxylate transporter permease [uncultured Phascolarctobacterium sp.]